MIGLSLFNGAGGAMMALDTLGVKVDKMYVSEIDKHANQASMLLFPEQIQLGDITKWTEWEYKLGVDLATVDIIFAGFPCQAWSMAGKQGGDSDPRGALVHDLLGLYDYIKLQNPDVQFMFENVAMKKQFMDFINELFGVAPVMINAALVTAQNRKRNYWASWEISQPDDLGIVLADILETDPVDITVMSEKFTRRNAHILRDDVNGKAKNLSDKSGCLTAVQKDNVVIKTTPTVNGETFDEWFTKTKHHGGSREEFDRLVEQENKLTIKNETLATNGKTHTLTASYAAGMAASNSVKRKQRSLIPVGLTDEETNQTCNGVKYRKLTPRECMRLQGWPEWVIEKLLNSGISNTQLYKMTGNGWPNPVIVHNLKCLFNTEKGKKLL